MPNFQPAKSAKASNKKSASPWNDEDEDFFPDDDEALLLCAAEAEEATFKSVPAASCSKSTSQKRVPKIPAVNPNLGHNPFPDDDSLFCAAGFKSAPANSTSTSRKRVSKIPAANPNSSNPFPDDDSLFCGADSWSEEPAAIKTEKFSQQPGASFKQSSISSFLAPSKVEKKSQVKLC